MASRLRASGEAAFNVGRIIGHARSTIVDTIYAHTVDSGLAGVSESVAGRVGLIQETQPKPPNPPGVSRQPKAAPHHRRAMPRWQGSAGH
jgi:hypothetical protein